MKTVDRILIGVLTIGIWALVAILLLTPATAQTAGQDEKAIFEQLLANALRPTTDSLGKPQPGAIGLYIEKNCHIQNGDNNKEVAIHCGSWYGDFTGGKKWLK